MMDEKLLASELVTCVYKQDVQMIMRLLEAGMEPDLQVPNLVA